MKQKWLFVTGFLFVVLAGMCYCGSIVFFDFENKGDIWQTCPGEYNTVNSVNLSDEVVLGGESSLKIEMEFPGEACIGKVFSSNLSKYRALRLNLYIPGNAPEDLQVLVFLQDGEWKWYQTKLIALRAGKWNRLNLDVLPESKVWQNIGHDRQWSSTSLSSIKRIGIKLFSGHNGKISIYMDEIEGEIIFFPSYSFFPEHVKRYEKVEISFHLSDEYPNPFNPSVVNVEGVFSSPSGKTVVIPGFYYQEYQCKLVSGEELISPVDYPYWKIRFTPVEEGVYNYYVRINDSKSEQKTQTGSFTVFASKHKGFIGVSSIDRQYFCFTDNSFFYPVGENIRSPTDARYDKLIHAKTPDDGTFYYEKKFKQMEQNGENFAEVWMPCWFTALEWIENRPGYKGVGYYNLGNAWKLDKILELAEKHGIYLQIIIINHGQLSTFCDQEWLDNPYNLKNGGFLNSPEEFFTNEKAKEYTRKQLRYITARWGYSPNIFSWVPVNEINLIGSKSKFFETQTVANWYKEIGGFLRETDPYEHLISCHYTILVDNSLLRDTVTDYIITNAYYNVTKQQSLLSLINNIYNFTERFGKPVFISEYGGTPHGSSMNDLKRDIIVGLWGCFHLPFAGIPLFWWHRMIEDEQLSHYYKNLSEYTADVDRIKLDLKREKLQLNGAGNKQLEYMALGNKFWTCCWIYDYSITKDISKEKPFSEFSDITVLLNNKLDYVYRVSFWDMEKGLIGETVLSPVNGKLEIRLPRFRKWIAFKIQPE